MKVLNRRQAADTLGLSERTLDRLVAEGNGPAYVRLDPRRKGYSEEALKAFLDARSFSSRAEELARGAV